MLQNAVEPHTLISTPSLSPALFNPEKPNSHFASNVSEIQNVGHSLNFLKFYPAFPNHAEQLQQRAQWLDSAGRSDDSEQEHLEQQVDKRQGSVGRSHGTVIKSTIEQPRDTRLYSAYNDGKSHGRNRILISSSVGKPDDSITGTYRREVHNRDKRHAQPMFPHLKSVRVYALTRSSDNLEKFAAGIEKGIAALRQMPLREDNEEFLQRWSTPSNLLAQAKQAIQNSGVRTINIFLVDARNIDFKCGTFKQYQDRLYNKRSPESPTSTHIQVVNLAFDGHRYYSTQDIVECGIKIISKEIGVHEFIALFFAAQASDSSESQESDETNFGFVNAGNQPEAIRDDRPAV